MRFLDTSLLIRFFTNEDAAKAERIRDLLERIDRGDERVALSHLVVFETIFTLQPTYKVPKTQIRQMIEDLLAMRHVQVPNKNLYSQALQLYESTPLSFGDAYNAVYMQSRDLSEVYSWDSDFDKLPGISRVEPASDEGVMSEPEYVPWRTTDASMDRTTVGTAACGSRSPRHSSAGWTSEACSSAGTPWDWLTWFRRTNTTASSPHCFAYSSATRRSAGSSSSS